MSQKDGVSAWMAWLYQLAHGFSLSFGALILAALVRLLFYGLRLRGGPRNFDPWIRGGRGLTHGASFTLLVFAVVARPCAAMPFEGPGQQVTDSGLTAMGSTVLLELPHPLHRSAPGSLVERSIGEDAGANLLADAPIFAPLQVAGPDELKQIAVRVLMYGRVDKYISVWLRDGTSEEEALQSISDSLLLDLSQLSIYAVRPQMPGDTLDVAIVPTWWKDSDMLFFVVDGSEVNRASYIAVASSTCQFAELRARIGPHWADGIDVYQGNSRTPINEHDAIHLQNAELLRLRFSGRARVELPTIHQAMQDTYWARDVENLGLPHAPPADGRILVIRPNVNYVFCAPVDISTEELHSRLARAAHSTVEALAMFVPNHDFELPAFRGAAVETVIALYPRADLPPTDSWTAIFVDARDLGISFDFQVHADVVLQSRSISSALGCDVVPGYEFYINGYERYLRDADAFRCPVGSSIAVWLDRPGLFVAEDETSQDSSSPPLNEPLPPAPVSPARVGVGEDSPRSRSPRRRADVPTSPTSAASAVEVLPTEPQHATVHATIFSLQEIPRRLSTRCSSTCSAEIATKVFHDMSSIGRGDTEFVPLRPQPVSSGMQFMLVPVCAFEAGRFPCLLDATWYGIPPFIFMSGPSITAGEVRDSFGADWPSSAAIFVLGAHRLHDSDGAVFVHRGLSLVMRPMRAAPPDTMSLQEKLAEAFVTRVQRGDVLAHSTQRMLNSFACLSPAVDDIIVRCPAGNFQGLRYLFSTISGLPEESFSVVTPCRTIWDFCCRGLFVEDIVGIQPRADEMQLGVFLDVRALGYEVRFICLPRSSMFLNDILLAAGVERPAALTLKVLGALSFLPDTEEVIFGQRSVLTVLIVPAADTPSAGLSETSFPTEDDVDDDDEGHGRGSSSPTTAPPPASTGMGPTDSGNAGSSFTFDGAGSQQCFMWKRVRYEHAVADCQPVDTPDDAALLSSVCYDSLRDLRQDHLGEVWDFLQQACIFQDESSPSAGCEKTSICLDAYLPAYSSSSNPAQRFAIDHGQCLLPVSDDMLRDLWKFVSFAMLPFPPENLKDAHGFQCWVSHSTLRRSPAPDEVLVLTSDGSFFPDSLAAGWGITLSSRSIHDDSGPGTLLGCLWGSFEPFRKFAQEALATMGAYLSEMVGLFWAAIVVLQLRWRSHTMIRCDNIAALDGVSGKAACKDHLLCNATRSLHLALSCCLGSKLVYQHVRGHRGDPANELADSLADYGVMGHHGHCDFGICLDDWLREEALPLAWLPHYLWSLYNPGAGPSFEDGVMSWDPQPPALLGSPAAVMAPFLRAFDHGSAGLSSDATGHIDLVMASFNALSLIGGDEQPPRHAIDDGGLHHSAGRVTMLCRSLERADITLCGIQEARTPAGVARVGPFWRLSSGTDDKHIYGNELWVHTQKPFCRCGSDALALRPEHFISLYNEPTILLVKLCNAAVNWFIAVIHAPHRAHPLHCRSAWWNKLERLCGQYGRDEDWFVLGDCNCRVGSDTSQHIGEWHADLQDESGELFHAFLRRVNAFVPCTFGPHMHGPGGTLVQKRNGALARSDYVGIPLHLQHARVACWVDAGITAGHSSPDHFATLLHLSFSGTCGGFRTVARAQRIDAAAIRDPTNAARISAIIRASPLHPWHCSSHEQAASITDYLYKALAAEFPLHARRLRRSCFSSSSDALHRELSRARHRLRGRKVALHNTFMRCAFLVWMQSREALTFSQCCAGRWLRLLRQGIAQDTFCIASLSRRLRTSCRADKRDYVAKLALELEDAPASNLYSAFHQLVKPRKWRRPGMRPLPQLRLANGDFCTEPQEVRDRWLEHFSGLECGTVVTAAELVEQSVAQQSRHAVAKSVRASDIPSMRDLAAAFKSVQGRRAPGPDLLPPELCRLFSFEMATVWWPVALKLFCLSVEPAGLKGGMQCVIPKPTGDRTLCSSSRAILLQPAVSKAFHRATRRMLSLRFESDALDFQIGGRRNYSALFGCLCSRVFLRHGRKYGISCAVTYVDLVAAYYAVVRELLFGLDFSTSSVVDIASSLSLDVEDLQCLVRHITEEPILCGDDAGEFLHALSRELHDATWFCLSGDGRIVRTRRGTRPGGSLADTLFSLLFAAVVRRSKAKEGLPAPPRICWDGIRSLDTLDSRWAGNQCVSLEEVVYADDLAAFTTAETASSILPNTTRTAGALFEGFQEHGLRINAGKHKTASMMTINGPGCRGVRDQVFNRLKAKIPILQEHAGSLWLDVVSRYKHLGAIVHFSGHVKDELAHRLNVARAMMKEGRREVYSNRTVKLERRVALFQANVLASLVHGAGTWPKLSVADHRTFHGGAMALYRQVLAIPATACQHWTSAEIQGALHLPDPAVLIHCERLRFLPLLLKTGPDALWALIRHDDDYMAGLRDSCLWLYERVKCTSRLGPPLQDWTSWMEFIQRETGKWKGMIKRAVELDILDGKLAALRDVTGRECWDAAPGAEPQDLVEMEHACLPCGLSFATFQQWGAHAHRSHAYVAPSTLHAHGTRCRACGTAFASNLRLRKHLQHSSSCLHIHEVGNLPFEGQDAPGHEQSLPVHVGPGPSRVPLPPPILPAFLEQLQARRPTSILELRSLAVSFIAPFQMLRNSLVAWLHSSDCGISATVSSALLEGFFPCRLGCKPKLGPPARAPYVFRPHLRPFPAVGSDELFGVICCGSTPSFWIRLHGLDDAVLCSCNFWDRFQISLPAAICVCIPDPPLACTSAWRLGSCSLRTARKFAKWSAQLQWWLSHAIRAAYAGAKILLRSDCLSFEQLEPFSSWCRTCSEGPFQSSMECFSFHLKNLLL